MPNIVNYLDYANRISALSRSHGEMAKFMAGNDKLAKAQSGSAEEYVANITEQNMQASLAGMNLSNAEAMKRISGGVHQQSLDAFYDATGMSPGDITNQQKRELQVLKSFVDNFRNDTTFDNIVQNASDNLRTSLPHRAGINPSVAFSMAFGNGAGIGREPGNDQIVMSLANNETFMQAAERVSLANDMYLRTKGISGKVKELAKDLIKGRMEKTWAPMGMALGITAAVMVSMSGPEQLPVAEYTSNSALTMSAKHMGGYTYYEAAEKVLKDLNMSSEHGDIEAFLDKSGYGDRLSETIPASGTASFRLPENIDPSELVNVTSYGEVKYNGATLSSSTMYALSARENFLNSREEKRDLEVDQGISMN